MKNGTISNYSKKGQIEGLWGTIFFIFIAGLTLVFGIIMMERTNESLEQEFFLDTDNATYLTVAQDIRAKISDIDVYRYNDTLAFWYNSSTSESWQFVVNTFGTQYTNGSLGDAVEYPVYWDGTDYYFCKTDATTFWEGYIDKISIYDGQLSSAEINDLYGETRW